MIGWIKVTILVIFLQNSLALEGSFKLNYEVRRGLSVGELEIGAKVKFLKRDDSFEIEIQNEKTYYVATLEVGSNGDKNKVALDTCSSDLWFMSNDVTCEYGTDLTKYTPQVVENENCIKYGSFSFEKSETFKKYNESSEFIFSRSDCIYSYGYWGTDSIKLNEIVIKDMTFAVANETNNDIGILGLGLLIGEQADFYYSNLPEILVEKGIINSSAYSIYFDPDANSGTVLFGAVDLSKYSGPLKTLPILDAYPQGFGVLLSGVYFSDGVDVVIIGNYTFAPTIDTFNTLSSLPAEIVRSIRKRLNATYTSSKAYMVTCEIDSDYELIFDFNGQQIRAPMSSFILEGTDGNCYLGILESPYAILGDNFLQNTYMVVDGDYTISLAQARYSKEENIEIIYDSIPNASKVPNYYYTEVYDKITLAASISVKTHTGKSTTTISGGNSAVPTSKFSNYCEFYTAKNDDETCEDIATQFNITATDIEEFNKFNDMWFGCDFIMMGDTFCISSPNSLTIVATVSTTLGSLPSLSSTTHSRRSSDFSTSKQNGLAGTIQVSNLLTSLLTILTYIVIV